MNEDREKTVVVGLTLKNFHIWLKEIKGLAIMSKIWTYVDPESELVEPADVPFPDVSAFMVPITVPGDLKPAQSRPAMTFDELTETQRDSFSMAIKAYGIDSMSL